MESLNNVQNQRLPLPPFTLETALQKVQLAEDAWNSKDPGLVSMAGKLSDKLKSQGADSVVISDECGDTLWEAVLAQGDQQKQSNIGVKD